MCFLGFVRRAMANVHPRRAATEELFEKELDLVSERA